MAMKIIEVKASKTYKIHIGEGLLECAAELIKNAVGVCKAVIVTDDLVNSLYCDNLETNLKNAGYQVSRFVFVNGEASKNMDILCRLLNFLAEENLTRTDAIIALGGGVVGDMAGFAAATYLRGIRFVQIPTTLLSAVDSSVGGKTAVNLDNGKNLAGAFYQPDIVICDYNTLSTLPQNVFSDGCAEVIKYGVILSLELFVFLEKNEIKNNLEYVISRCVEIKRDIVCEDEHDNGVRRLLNFGHTVGHAIEKCSSYSIPHGSAVGIGMIIAAKGAYAQKLCSGDFSERIAELLTKNLLPIKCDFTANELYKVALSDKKRKGNEVALIVPEQLGKCVTKNINAEELLPFIKGGLS